MVAWRVVRDNDGGRDNDDRAHDGDKCRSRVSARCGASGLGHEEEHLMAKFLGTAETMLSRRTCDSIVVPSRTRKSISLLGSCTTLSVYYSVQLAPLSGHTLLCTQETGSSARPVLRVGTRPSQQSVGTTQQSES